MYEGKLHRHRLPAVLVVGLLMGLLGGIGSPAHSARPAGSNIHLQVPGGFQGPIRATPNPQATVTAYVKPYPERAGGTRLQIAAYEVGAQLVELPEEQRGPAADSYLAEFLDGIASRQTSFERAATTHLQLDGRPASMARWHGAADGKRVSGVMYTVVVGTRVILLHTQDVDPAPPENREAAIRAIESVTFSN